MAIPIGATFSDGIGIFRRYWRSATTIVFVIIVIMTAMDHLTPRTDTGADYAIYTVKDFLRLLLEYGLLAATLQMAAGQFTPGLRSELLTLDAPIPRLPAFAAVAIVLYPLSYVITTCTSFMLNWETIQIGYMLFPAHFMLLPVAFLLGLRLVFALPLLFETHLSVSSTFSESWRLTRGNLLRLAAIAAILFVSVRVVNVLCLYAGKELIQRFFPQGPDEPSLLYRMFVMLYTWIPAAILNAFSFCVFSAAYRRLR